MQDRIIAILSIVVLTFVLGITVYGCWGVQKDLNTSRSEVIELQHKLSDCQAKCQVDCIERMDSVINAARNEKAIDAPIRPNFLR